MDDTKKPAAKPREQNPLWWLLGVKETADERTARETREANDKRTKETIRKAIVNIPVAKKVVDESKGKAKK